MGTLGVEGAFEVAWGEELLSELLEVLTRPQAQNGFGWSLAAAEAVAGYVRAAFPDGNPGTALVADSLEVARTLVRDPEDDHVVALALAAAADCIITADKRGFMPTELLVSGITLITPDRFLLDLYRDIPQEVLEAIDSQISKTKAYPANRHDILSLLYRAGCRRFATEMSALLALARPDPKQYAPT